METTIIDKENLQYFKTLLLPQAREMLGTGAPLFALGAVDGGMACGALTGGPLGGCFHIDSLFVAPSCRGRGVGTALLDELVRVASQEEKLTELRCEYTISCGEHERLEPFLRRYGFEFQENDDATVSVPLDKLADFAFFKNTQPSCVIHTLSEMSDSMIRSLDRRLTADTGPLFDQPLDSAPLDSDCSTVTVKDSAIDACCLIEKKGEKLISLAYADAGSTTGGGSVFSSMLITAYRLGVKAYPAGTQILIQPVTPLSRALVERIAPNARKLSRTAVRSLRN